MARARPYANPELSEEDRDFYRWYGPWRPLTPRGMTRVMRGANLRWWIVGGWAVDAFTGTSREHEDIDVSFFKSDLPALLDHLSPHYCVWSNHSGTLRPMRKLEDMIDGARQLWVRRDGYSPWLFDLAMNPHDGDTWISARHDHIRVHFDEATYVTGGIRYLQPEIVLWMKAHRAHGKDERDLAQILPRLDRHQVDWLRATMESTHPGHRWLATIGGS